MMNYSLKYYQSKYGKQRFFNLLYYLYWSRKLSLENIAVHFKAHRSTIALWMDRGDIKRRHRNASQWGRKLSEETKEKISKTSKKTRGNPGKFSLKHRKNISKGLTLAYATGKKTVRPRTEYTKLAFKIRGLIEYKEWREAILKRDIKTYPVIPKNIQVHHYFPFKELLIKNNIKTREDAMSCKQLWDINIGCAITKGEHYILTLLERPKAVSKGFLRILQSYIAQHEATAKNL